MSSNFIVNAEVRDDLGKGASRRLRREGKVPAVMYGANADPVSMTIGHNEVIKHLDDEAFYSHLLTVNVGGTEEKAILRDLQRHPHKAIIMHMDFQRVDENTPIHIKVPLHFINEDSCAGVKDGGQISHSINEVEISVLPKDLPEYIEVDMADVAMDQTVHLSDLKLPEGATVIELTHGASHDQAVVSIHAPKAVTVETDAPVAPEAEGEDAAE